MSEEPMVVNGDEFVKMLLHAFAAVFGILEGAGVCTMDQAGRMLADVEIKDPAPRAFIEELSRTLRRDHPPLTVIEGGKTD